MLICNWLLYISVWFLHWSFGTYSNTICPLTLRYWLSFRALVTMKSNTQGLFTHITYLKEEWQNDSNKLHVGGQCAQRTLRTSGCQSFPSSRMALHHRVIGDRCFETAGWCHLQGSVEDENTTFPDFHYRTHTSETENSHFQTKPQTQKLFSVAQWLLAKWRY